jgi:hypothetical protein
VKIPEQFSSWIKAAACLKDFSGLYIAHHSELRLQIKFRRLSEAALYWQWQKAEESHALRFFARLPAKSRLLARGDLEL